MNSFPGTQWLLPQLLPDISIKQSTWRGNDLRLSNSKILQLATFVDLQPAGGDQAPDRREKHLSHTPNRWCTETGGKKHHCTTKPEEKPTQTLRLSRLLRLRPVFSSQKDGWDKHTSNAPDTPHIYQRLLIFEHIL